MWIFGSRRIGSDRQNNNSLTNDVYFLIPGIYKYVILRSEGELKWKIELWLLII